MDLSASRRGYITVPESKAAGWSALTALYVEERDERVRSGLAAAIAAAADDQVIGEVIALARDRRHGASRLLLLSALERSDAPQAHAALTDLETDADLREEIAIIMKRLRRGKR